MTCPTVLLTGGTGFVGSRVAAAYAAAECDLRCTVRATSDTRWIDDLRAEQVELDLRDPGALHEALGGVSLVVHVAGVTTATSEETFFTVNTEGTLTLAKAAAEAGAERFVFISSLAARGPDPEGSPPGAEAPDSPVSPYGMSKRAAEERLRAFEGEMEVTVLRPGGVYGPRDRDLLPLFRMASRGFLAVPAGDNLLQPVYVGDVARATLLAGRGRAGFGPYPVVGEGRYTWADMGEALRKAVGREVRVVKVPGQLLLLAAYASEAWARLRNTPPALDRRRARDLAKHRWTADPSPTMRDLGWEPHVDLPGGVRRTVRWYREQGWL